MPPQRRLFCFPYAGGGASAFRGWAAELPAEVDVYAIQSPGRDERLFEPAPRDIGTFLDAVVPEIARLADLPFAIFGHSLGAITGWESAVRLREQYGEEPDRLFLSGCRALPAVHLGRRELHLLDDAQLTAELRAMNGTPEEVLGDAQFMRLLLPTVRADYEMFSRYRYRPSAPPSPRVTVFGGLSDPAVELHYLRQWEDLLPGVPDIVVLPGDHFFLHSARQELLAELADRMLNTPDEPPQSSSQA